MKKKKLKSKKESALDVTLSGSIGAFRVAKADGGESSVEAKFFLTHLSLNPSDSHQKRLLANLAPVREVFNLNELDFDELMQRDIDDARVSNELIPYLLDSGSRDQVKLFPPIIIVLLPTSEGEGRPAKLYPRVEQMEEASEELEDAMTIIQRCGEPGAEVFQFQHTRNSDGDIPHDFNKLRLNTSNSKLVIVDGQHRAMAMLALYRNITAGGWTDSRRQPYEEYYKQWFKSDIENYDLAGISLPLMICTFPELQKGYSGQLTVPQASRAIFLVLNKTAKKVSSSRNKLLDDSDVIAEFLRRTLQEIKSLAFGAPTSLRIWNVELEQADRKRLASPIAITTTNHIYYLIEHLMLNKRGEDIKGLKRRKGTFANRTNLDESGLYTRLDARDHLGLDRAANTRRDSYDAENCEILCKQYLERYGTYINDFFQKFRPFKIHAEETLKIYLDLEAKNERKLLTILFGGQGANQVFQEHLEYLTRSPKTQESGELEGLVRSAKEVNERLADQGKNLSISRAEKFLKPIKLKKGTPEEKTSSTITQLYDQVFFTQAFQTACVTTFFWATEKSETEASKIYELFREYLEQLNEFFLPQETNQLKRLVGVFFGTLTLKEWKIVETNHGFKQIISFGEMQPEEFPKYRYLMLELWRPQDGELKGVIDAEVEKCRKQGFKTLSGRNRNDYCRDKAKVVDELTDQEKKTVDDKSFTQFKNFLKLLNVDNMPSAIGDLVSDTEDVEVDLEDSDAEVVSKATKKKAAKKKVV